MTVARIKQRPIELPSGDPREAKQGLRTQFGALCWRVKGSDVQILLVTSRHTKRWILPKGWPVDGETPAKAAANEAWEEAGAKGKVIPICLGIYSYNKRRTKREPLPCVVAVFPMNVGGTEKKWPESKQRQRKWVSPRKASRMVDEPELARILREFDPAGLPD